MVIDLLYVLTYFHTIKSILNEALTLTENTRYANFHTIKSILNQLLYRGKNFFYPNFHTIKSILNLRGKESEEVGGAISILLSLF